MDIFLNGKFGQLTIAFSQLATIALYYVAVYNMCTEGKPWIKDKVTNNGTYIMHMCITYLFEGSIRRYLYNGEGVSNFLYSPRSWLEQVCSSNVLVCSLSVVIQISLHVYSRPR